MAEADIFKALGRRHDSSEKWERLPPVTAEEEALRPKVCALLNEIAAREQKRYPAIPGNGATHELHEEDLRIIAPTRFDTNYGECFPDIGKMVVRGDGGSMERIVATGLHEEQHRRSAFEKTQKRSNRLYIAEVSLGLASFKSDDSIFAPAMHGLDEALTAIREQHLIGENMDLILNYFPNISQEELHRAAMSSYYEYTPVLQKIVDDLAARRIENGKSQAGDDIARASVLQDMAIAQRTGEKGALFREIQDYYGKGSLVVLGAMKNNARKYPNDRYGSLATAMTKFLDQRGDERNKFAESFLRPAELFQYIYVTSQEDLQAAEAIAEACEKDGAGADVPPDAAERLSRSIDTLARLIDLREKTGWERCRHLAEWAWDEADKELEAEIGLSVHDLNQKIMASGKSYKDDKEFHQDRLDIIADILFAKAEVKETERRKIELLEKKKEKLQAARKLLS
jgi:hypothetical protein